MFIANVLQPLIDACQWVLEFWHGVIGDFPNSWGWSIILLTFTVRILILPLTFKGVKAMQRLQGLQPEIKKIQERYKDDKQRMNQEVMAFYQREKVNPLGSCMPLLLQIPFFISLFYLLRSDAFQAGHRRQPGLLRDRQPRREGHRRPGAARLADRALRRHAARGEPVTAISADPMQRRIMLALPFVFVIFIINFEAGLIVYWITTNVWTIGQQLLVKKLYPKPVLDAEAEAEKAASKPARGKPPPVVAAADGGDAGDGEAKDGQKAGPKGGQKAAPAPAGGGGARTKAPPASPRKKKKRSGRRR